MKKKELLKQSARLAAIIAAVTIMDAPTTYGAEQDNTDDIQTSSQIVAEETMQEGTQTEATSDNVIGMEDSSTEEGSAEETVDTEKSDSKQDENSEEAESDVEDTAEDDTENDLENDVEDKIDDQQKVTSSKENTDIKTTLSSDDTSDDTEIIGETTETKTGWVQDGDDWYYYTEDGTPAEGFTEIDGNTYYFDSEGRRYTNTTFESYNEESGKYEDYRVDEQGRLVKGWYTDENNDTFYYNSDGSRAEGFTEIDGYTYYFSEKGEMIVDSEFIYYDSNEGKNKLYRTDQNGHLYKGWYASKKVGEEGVWYYYGEDGAAAEDITAIDGKTYCFSAGRMLVNQTQERNGIFYYFGSDGAAQVERDLSKEGWFQANGDWYYAKGGQLVENAFVVSGKYTYYMQSDGTMAVDTTFSVYDQVTGEIKEYRVDAQGHLVKGWYEQGEDVYYYGVDGVQVEGLTVIDGKTYYFHYRMCKDYGITIDGVFYYFGSDGVLSTQKNIEKDGWFQVEGKWYYARNKELVTNEFLKSGNHTYYLGYDGVMYTDREFWIMNQETWQYTVYRVDAQGHLVIGWYKDGTDWRYYGEDGAMVNGLATIDGKTYYFSGCMQKNYGTVIDGTFYYFGSDGVLSTKKSLDKDGWMQAGNDWFYVRNHNLVQGEFIKSGQYTYYMDYDGKMAVNTTFWYSNPESGAYSEYRVDAQGHLITGWYKDFESWYYYGKDGARVEGLATIDGKTYYFEYTMRTDYGTVIDGTFYYFGSDGVLSIKKSLDKDGWMQVNDKWFYVRNNDLVKNEFVKSGKYTYYMGYDGSMYTDTEFGLYDDTTDNYKYYKVDEQGHLITGWYREYDHLYYYGTDGVRADGVTVIGGKTYYFDGYMQKNCAAVVDGTFYYFGEDGEQQVCKSINKDAWVHVNEDWYYVKNKELLQNTMQKIGNYIYVFNESGRMVVNATGIIFNGPEESFAYRTDQDGHAITGWYYENNSGEWYYYQNDGKAQCGIAVINNVRYYFSGDGQMLKNKGAAADGVLYYFGKDGKVTQTVSLATDGWKKLPTGYYYAKNGDIVTNQFMTIGDSTYYFFNNGVMACNGVYYLNRDNLIPYYFGFDSNGRLIKGWYKANTDFAGAYQNNIWFYFDQDGHGLSGIQKVNNTWYYFENGRMCVNKKDSRDGKLYIFGLDGIGREYTQDGWVNDRYYIENGKLVTGWKQISGKWYYFDKYSAEKVKSGKEEINGAMYYFNSLGEMMTGFFHYMDGSMMYADANGKLQNSGWYQSAEGNWYYFKDAVAVTGAVEIGGNYNIFRKDGIWVKALNSTQNGWLNDNGEYYYLENGKPVINDSRVVKGATYFFDNEGLMLKNCVYDNHYLLNSGAMLVNGWREILPGIYSYYDADGKVVSKGWKKIGSSWYYFEDEIMNTQDKIINGKLYKFSSNGSSDGVGRGVLSGWNLIAGQYYYIKDNEMVKETSMEIGGQKYFFDYEGRMLYETVVRDQGKQYYVNKDGAVIKNSWCNNGDSYAGSDGVLYSGKHTIGDKTYLFESSCMLTRTNELSEDSKLLYLVDKNGIVTGTINAQKEGWLQTPSGDWYYVKNGSFVRDCALQIGSKYYYFIENGKMLKNDVYFGIGYAGADGSISTDGWVNDTLYLENGDPVSYDTRKINGKYYMFSYIYSSNGIRLMDGEYYYFDGKGNRIAQNDKLGWIKAGNDWYYMSKEDDICVDSCMKIGNTYYYFDYEGKMMKNNFASIYDGSESHWLYFGENGAVEKNCWKTIDGKTYYIDANGWATIGKHQIDGKWYIFDDQGALL